LTVRGKRGGIVNRLPDSQTKLWGRIPHTDKCLSKTGSSKRRMDSWDQGLITRQKEESIRTVTNLRKEGQKDAQEQKGVAHIRLKEKKKTTAG